MKNKIILITLLLICSTYMTSYAATATKHCNKIEGAVSSDDAKEKDRIKALSDSYSASIPVVIPSSPQSQLFEKYVNHPVTEYNGLPNIEIPLYEIKMKGLSIPITLSYHAGGIKYMEFDGDVGAGWSINAGGYRVTRNVYGKDDFKYVPYNKKELSEHLNKGGYFQDAYLASIAEFGKPNYEVPTHINSLTDGEYDQFTYLIPSSNGNFLLTKREKQGTQIKVTETCMIGENQDKIESINSSNVEITDGSGYNYKFGGNQNDGTLLVENTPNAWYGKTPTAWLLREIKSPFNETVDFSYQSFLDVTDPEPTRTFNIIEPLIYHGPGVIDMETHSYERTFSQTGKAEIFYVEQIESDNEIISFVRSGTNQNMPARFIKEITVKGKHSQKEILKIEFGYKELVYFNIGGLFYVEYKLHIPEFILIKNGDGKIEKKYGFEYIKPNVSFSKMCPDQWGYIKAGADILSNPILHEDFKTNLFQYESGKNQTIGKYYNNSHIQWMNRSYNDNTNLHSYSLKKIIYPTGGYKEFEYEPNQYYQGKIIKGGGQRIKKITSSEKNGEKVLTSLFKYGSNEDGNGNASFLFTSKMFADETYYYNFHPLQPIGSRAIRTYSPKPLGELARSYFNVSYPCVTTYNIVESASGIKTNGKTITKYKIPAKFWTNEMASFQYNYAGKYAYPMIIDRYFLGVHPMLNEKLIYDEKGIIKQEKYLYETKNSNLYEGIKIQQKIFFNNSQVSIINPNPIISNPYGLVNSLFNYAFYNISTEINLLSSKIVTDFTPKGVVVMEESYEYDDKNRLKKTRKTNSQGTSVEKDLTYPSVNSELYKKNMLMTVVQESTTNNNVHVGTVKYDYPLNSILPNSVITSIGENSRTDGNFSYDQATGNLLEYKSFDGLNTVYIWGYKKKYPIAEIKSNSYTYSQIETIVNSVFKVGKMDELSNLVIPDESKLTNGSLQKALPNAIVTTYTYKPLVGMLTATDPTAFTTFYEYDEHNRLKRTYFKEDGKDRNIQLYEYNYDNK